MAQSFTLTFADAMALRLKPVVEWRARDMARHPKVLAFLDGRDIDDLTPRQQAELVLKFYLYRDLKLYEREQAEIVAGRTAEESVDQDFNLGE